MRSRASAVYSKARDSTSERLGFRHFPRPFGSSLSYMTLVRYVSQSSSPAVHQATQPTIFDDLAQEAVRLCRASLLNAADAFGARRAIDGQLFLVRHLLILMGHHHRHLIFHAIAHIDAPSQRALHIPPRLPRRTPLGRKAHMYPPSPFIRRYAHILCLS